MKILRIILLVSFTLLQLPLSDGWGVSDPVLDEANRVIADGRKYLKEVEENKAFGKLMFGDDYDTVVTRLRMDDGLKVNYPFPSGEACAEFEVSGARIILKPEFYRNKLYKVTLSGLMYSHGSPNPERDYKIFKNLIEEKYGPPDNADIISASGRCMASVWICGKKRIDVFYHPKQSSCFIYDSTVEDAIKKTEYDKEHNEIKEKSSYF